MLTAAQQEQAPLLSRWLRSQTRSAHVEAESRLDLGSMRSHAQLIALLAGWRHVWSAVHRAAGSSWACPLATKELLSPAAQSLHWLTSDLIDLGADLVDDHAAESAAESRVVSLLGAPATSWGVAYVLRGSRLGGAVLAPRVRALLSLPADHGTRFLASSGSEPGREWSAFRHRLDGYPLAGAERSAAVGAARWTFMWVGASMPSSKPVTAIAG